MPKTIKFLEMLPLELQEKVLRELSVEKVDVYLDEIEIDGKMYKAEKEVIKLIDGLVLQLEKLESKLKMNYEA